MTDVYVALHHFLDGRVILYSPAKLKKMVVDSTYIKGGKVGSWYKVSNSEKDTTSIAEVRAPLDTRIRKSVLEIRTLMIFFGESYCDIVGHSLGFGTIANFLTNKLSRNVVYRGWIAYMEPFPCNSFHSVLDAVGCAWALVETPKETADLWQTISTISGLNLDTTQGLVVGRMSNLQVEILNLTDGQLYTCDQSKLMPGDFVNFTPVHFSVKHVVRKEYAFDPRIDSTWERNTDVRVVEREPQLKIFAHEWNFGSYVNVIDVPKLQLFNLWFKNDDKRKLATMSPQIGEPIVLVYDRQDCRFYLDDTATNRETDIDNQDSINEADDKPVKNEAEFQSKSSTEPRFSKSANTLLLGEEKTIIEEIEFSEKSSKADETQSQSQCKLPGTMSKSQLAGQVLVCDSSTSNVGEKIVENEVEYRQKLSLETPKLSSLTKSPTFVSSSKVESFSAVSPVSDVSLSSTTANKEDEEISCPAVISYQSKGRVSLYAIQVELKNRQIYLDSYKFSTEPVVGNWFQVTMRYKSVDVGSVFVTRVVPLDEEVLPTTIVNGLLKVERLGNATEICGYSDDLGPVIDNRKVLKAQDVGRTVKKWCLSMSYTNGSCWRIFAR